MRVTCVRDARARPPTRDSGVLVVFTAADVVVLASSSLDDDAAAGAVLGGSLLREGLHDGIGGDGVARSERLHGGQGSGFTLRPRRGCVLCHRLCHDENGSALPPPIQGCVRTPNETP